MSAFGPAAAAMQSWCNLCRTEGVSTQFDPEADDFLAIVEMHTLAAHPEHVAALARGEVYEPVEVRP